jgi:hypothetical protein
LGFWQKATLILPKFGQISVQKSILDTTDKKWKDASRLRKDKGTAKLQY